MTQMKALGYALLLLWTSMPASAATLSEVKYAGWTIGAYSDDTSGAFSHCGATVSYKSGTTLLFGLGTGGWTIGLANGTWKLPANAKYPVALQIDRNQAMSLTAVAITPQVAVAPLETSAYLFQMFRRGRLLNIQAAGELMQFDLTNSSKVLDMTLACAQARMNSQATSNPFSVEGSASGSATSKSVAIDHKAEVTAFLANVLSAAGIQGFSLSPEVSPDLRPWEVVWTAPQMVGLARIDESSTVDEAALMIAAGDGSSCKANFATAKQTSPDGKIILLKTACRAGNDGKSSSYSYTIVPRASGGAFISATSETQTEPEQPPAEDVGPRLLQASQQYLAVRR